MRWVLLSMLLWKSETPYIQIVYQNFLRGNHLIYKLVHTFRGSSWLKYSRDSQRTGIKVEKKRFPISD